MSPTISAIFEITIMLLGALAVGMFITWQYWKNKYGELLSQHQKLEKEHQALNESHQTLTKEHQSLNESHQSLKDGHQTLQKEFDSYKQQMDDKIKKHQAENGKLKKENDELAKSLENLKKQSQEEAKTLIAQVENLGSKVQQLEKANQTDKELRELSVRQLQSENETLQQELETQTAVATQRRKPAKRYYRTIGDKKYDDAALKIAEKAVAGRGDGRISMSDVEKLFLAIADHNEYTDIEKATIKYIREHFSWTPEADELFRAKVRDWVAERATS